MKQLVTTPNFAAPGQPGRDSRASSAAGDAFYAALVAAHDGLSDAQSELMNARLVLLLANHVGELDVLQQAIAAARSGLPPNPEQADA